MILKPTLNPDEIFNQMVDLNNEMAEQIRLQDEVERISRSYSTINLN